MQFNWLLGREVWECYFHLDCLLFYRPGRQCTQTITVPFSMLKINHKNPVYQACPVRCRNVIGVYMLTPTEKFTIFVTKHAQQNIAQKISSSAMY